jgi:outer membrane protein W
MRYLTVLAVLLFIAAGSSFGQHSVGFSNPDNIDPLLEYRLPDWGYSNFYLDFDMQANGSDQKERAATSVEKQGDFYIRPDYDLYRESESRIFRFNTSLALSYTNSASKSSSEFTSTNSERTSQGLGSNLYASANLREYMTEHSFLYAGGSTNFEYDRSKREVRENDVLDDKRFNYRRRIDFNPRLGYGFGRVRNVGPVIRAVRLAERLDALPANVSMGNQDIRSAADQFTRYDGYQQRYDRPEKYFWGDMNENTAADLSALDSFDMLYLTDVLNEAIGQRLEGWEVYGGAEFNYDNDLLRTESPLAQPEVINRNERIRKSIGAFVNSRWYKNTSLRQQWGLIGNASVNYQLGDQEGSATDRTFRFETGVEWLWNMTDRFLLDAALRNVYSQERFADSTGGNRPKDYSEWNNNLYLDMNFSYFIENSLSLTFSFDSSLRHSGNTESNQTLDNRVFNVGATLGLRYYFNRNLY